MEVFSTITSPVFSELVIVLAGYGISYLSKEVVMFETLRKMHEVRPFKLVFSFEGPCFVFWSGRPALVEPRRELKEVLDSLATNGLLDFLGSPPTIRIVTQLPHYEWDFPSFD